MAYTVTQLVAEARRLLNEPAAVFWSDAELSGWVAQAALDLSVKARCVEGQQTISFDGSGVRPVPAGAIGIEAVLSAEGESLAKVRPRQFGHMSRTRTGKPTAYAHFAGHLYVFPRPAGVVSVSLTVLYWRATMTLADLPEAYHVLALLYVVAQAKLKDEQYAVAGQLADLYTQGLLYQRHDLQERTPDSREMLRLADRIVAHG